jgi:putative transferase (TIGR04331 family)
VSRTGLLQLTRLRPMDADPAYLLGPWCRAGGDAEPPVLDGYARMDEDEAQRDIDEAYHVGLAQAAAWWNGIHGLDRPERYWELIAYRLLSLLAMEYFYRYRYLRAVLRENPGLRPVVLHPDDFVTPADDLEAWDWYDGSDAYNLQLFSLAATALGAETVTLRLDRFAGAEGGGRALRLASSREGGRVSAMLRELVRRPYPATGPGTVVLFPTHFRPEVVEELARDGGYRLSRMTFPTPPLRRAPVDPRVRARLEQPAEAGEFTRAYLETLRVVAPRDYVEDFAHYHRLARRVLRRGRPAVVAGAFIRAMAHRVWLAEARATPGGPRLVLIQHGGSYGEAIFARNPWAFAEPRLADVFATWGWGEGEPGLRPLPGPRLAAPRAAEPGDEVLIVSGTARTYVTHERFFGVPPESETVGRFFDHLGPGLLAAARYRGHPRNGAEEMPWRDRHPAVRVDDGTVPAEARVAAARLVVTTYAYSTTFLECMAMDRPVVALVEGGVPWLNDRARPLYAELVSVGVVHHDAARAARMVNEVYPDVEGWWMEPRRRAAVQAYRNTYARTSDDAVDQWRRFLRDQVAAQTARDPRPALVAPVDA